MDFARRGLRSKMDLLRGVRELDDPSEGEIGSEITPYDPKTVNFMGLG